MELTQEHFDQSMKAVFDYVASKESADNLSKRMDVVEKTLEVHTKSLRSTFERLGNTGSRKISKHREV